MVYSTFAMSLANSYSDVCEFVKVCRIYFWSPFFRRHRTVGISLLSFWI